MNIETDSTASRAQRQLAETVIKSGLGKAELEAVTSYATALFWFAKDSEVARVRNGSCFFLDPGAGAFAVTAAHVVAGWRADRVNRGAGKARLAGNGLAPVIDLDERLIDLDDEIDIATFRIKTDEVSNLGKAVLAGSQKAWPPPPPLVGRGVLIGGYPGAGTRLISGPEVSFGSAPAGLIAHSVSEIDISCVLERVELIGLLGGGLPPENFDFGGMSGGPMITIFERPIGPNGFLPDVAGWNADP